MDTKEFKEQCLELCVVYSKLKAVFPKADIHEVFDKLSRLDDLGAELLQREFLKVK